jgi:hypothetical protein
MNIAEMYETDARDPAKACEAYEAAADLYKSENADRCVNGRVLSGLALGMTIGAGQYGHEGARQGCASPC